MNDLYIGGDKNMAGLDLMMYKDGLKEGRAEGSLNTILSMFKKGIIKIANAAKELGISEKEFMKLAKV